MRAQLTGLIGLAAAVAFAASGCGGSSNTSASVAGGPGGSSIVPASAPVFVAIDSDLSSDQWKKTNALLDMFPGRDKWLAQLRQSFEKDAKVSWENDVKPALGKELDVVVLDLGKRTEAVGLTQPADAAKFDALVKKANTGSGTLVATDYKGWKVFSDSQAKLDAFKKLADAGGSLADDATFKAATATLSADALVKAYANGAKATAALNQALPNAGGNAAAGPTKLVSGAAELLAEDDGLRLHGTFKTTGLKQQPKTYTAALPDQVPAGALLYLSFSGEGLGAQGGLGKQLQKGGGAALPQLQLVLPLLGRLGGLLGHENALYVRPGVGIPEVTLVTQPDAPAQGMATLDQLVAGIGIAGAAKPVTIGTTKAKMIDLGRISIYYGVAGGKLLVTNQQQAFQDLTSGGSKLSGDATYKEALAAAAMPAATNGFLYVNLKDSVPLIETLAGLGGSQIPADVGANLRPLRTAVAWATAGDNEGSLSVFLEIK